MGKRSYKQNCSLARAADVIGERWTLLLVRDLMLGPRRFSELNRSCKGMGPNLLTGRLRELEQQGLVSRTQDKEGTRRYRLTRKGRSLEPIVLTMVRWGLEHTHEVDAEYLHLAEWDLVALKAHFNNVPGADLQVTVQFVAPDLHGWVRVEDAQVSLGIGVAESPDVTVYGTVSEFFGHDQSGRKPRFTGNAVALQQFVETFSDTAPGR